MPTPYLYRIHVFPVFIAATKQRCNNNTVSLEGVYDVDERTVVARILVVPDGGHLMLRGLDRQGRGCGVAFAPFTDRVNPLLFFAFTFAAEPQLVISCVELSREAITGK